MPNTSESDRSKSEFLREEGTLNPAAQQVLDAKFRESEFFDPRDLVQVKYEMLRRVSIENAAVVQVVQDFGVSRPTYYQAKANLERAGIAGLVPKKRGPRGPHKLQGDVLAFLKQQLVSGRAVTGSAIVETAWAGVPPQGPSEDDRASAAWKKNCPMIRGDTESSSVASSSLRVQYECLRLAALGEPLPPQARSGLLLFLRRGMWGWARGLSVTPTALPQSSQAPSSDRAAACGERQAAIQLLAQMAVNGLKRRSS